MKGEFKTFTGKSLCVWPPFWTDKALWTWVSHNTDLRGYKERLDDENALSRAISLYCVSEKRAGTHITLMASQFDVLCFGKSEAASICRSLNNLLFCACFTTANMVIREHFSAEQVPFDFFFLIGRIHMRLLQRTFCYCWKEVGIWNGLAVCMCYPLNFQASWSRQRTFISALCNRRTSVETIWWKCELVDGSDTGENWCTVLQWDVIMDFVKICNFRRSARCVSLGVTAAGNAPLKVGTWTIRWGKFQSKHNYKYG
jgi:hypothetical protein